MTSHTHHTVRKSIRERIESSEWELGERIPAEADLAIEYGCARTTINRALQALAHEGLVIRKRKGGTRVCQMPTRQAKFEIQIVREQVEATGSAYRHQLINQKVSVPPSSVQTRLRLPERQTALYMETVHLADNQPFAYEQRWVNTQSVPQILEAPLDELSANEWLIKTVPFSRGDISFMAVNADENIAKAIEAEVGTAVFVVDRTTWYNEQFITTMKLYYHEGYTMYSRL